MSRNFWIGLVASVVVVALAVGGLFLASALHDPDVELPDEVGGLVARDSTALYDSLDREVDDQARENIASQAAADDYNSDGFSKAFDGADVDSRVYLGDDGERIVAVLAIAADAGPLVPDSFDDPDFLQTAFPRVERVTEGDVECLLYRTTTIPAGEDYDEDDAEPSSIRCQRRSGSLTVRVVETAGDPQLDTVVDLTGELWDELD